MALRRLLRGQIAWPRLEAVVREVLERYDEPAGRVEFLDADNWLSTPMVVNDRYFVKAISEQHSLLHAILTTGRNVGAFTSGTEGFFEHFGTPLEMAEHELEATRRMAEVGLNVPEPREAFEVDGLGVLVLEYVPAFRSFEELDAREVRGLAPDLFDALDRMHAAELAHGDLRSENVLVSNGDLYFIDATSIRDGITEARAYDVACALGVLTPLLGPRETVSLATERLGVDALLEAREFLDFVTIRPDHDFDAAAVKGEIEKHAAD
ncbi:RIO1 family regulatory kinase/ATPase domain-containing protein [Halorhabdus rudnickae]|uniref:RIO1 family regulatory kinase/ATPase domain-containing protein n=1 Tax=Halorhabdus rudnickae TaxID=1775544 RepID=UPI001083A4B8|nr:RIO1 family regulatory kinase/ATPase [Halorhabdus rudnickae]